MIFEQTSMTMNSLVSCNCGFLKYEALDRFFQEVHVFWSFVSEAVSLFVFLVLVGFLVGLLVAIFVGALCRNPRRISCRSPRCETAHENFCRTPRWNPRSICFGVEIVVGRINSSRFGVLVSACLRSSRFSLPLCTVYKSCAPPGKIQNLKENLQQMNLFIFCNSAIFIARVCVCALRAVFYFLNFHCCLISTPLPAPAFVCGLIAAVGL